MQWKKDNFYGDWFSLTIFIYERYATEKHTIVLALASWFTACNFWPWKVNFKIWPHIRPGQGQVMSQVSQYALCISFEADWRAKSLGTICATLSPSCRELLAKSGLWPHVTSYDFPWPADQLHPDQHSWDEWSWSWKLWMVSVSSCETRSIFILLHRLITKRS